MNPYQIHAETFSELQAEMGDDCPTFDALGDTWNIVPGSATFNEPLRDGGFSQMFDLSFDATAGQFIPDSYADANALKEALLNQPMTYLGVSYKVVNVRISAGAAIITIEANALNQNA